MNLPIPSSPEDLETFRDLESSSEFRAWGIKSKADLAKIYQRFNLFVEIQEEILALGKQNNLEPDSAILGWLWWVWLPLALDIEQNYQVRNLPLIQGILGAQGTGKTTLTKVVCCILQRWGYRTLAISLDDLYKTYQDRQELLKQDPDLIWRGPPGTHDVELGIAVLQGLKNYQPGQIISIPRFDKSLHQGAGDRISFELINYRLDMIFFEGWFVGVPPLTPSQFEHFPSPIVTSADRQFSLRSNQRLASYLPLWDCLDYLLVLIPMDYRWSKQWRLDAEQKMIAQGKTGMSASEIEQFVDYFWKALHPQLFIEPMIQNSELVDLVIKLDSLHQPCQSYKL